MPLAGTCKICLHPQRDAIDRLIVKGIPILEIERVYSTDKDTLCNHRDAGHVAEALAVYAEERKPFQIDIGGIYEKNVRRLGKAQDACDRWLTDPEDAEEYDLGPRAEEITVIYEDGEDLTPRGKPTRKKAKLAVLLREAEVRNGVTVTGFESRHADPRRLLTDYSAELRGELDLYLQSLWKAEENAEKAKLAGMTTTRQQEKLALVFSRMPLEQMLAAIYEETLGVGAEEAKGFGAEHADALRRAMVAWVVSVSSR